MATRVAVDIGGTFTDLVHADGADIGVAKSSTTPGRFEDGVMAAVGEAEIEDVAFLAHGTTVVINALTERTGTPTALLTTRGCRDVLEVGKANRPDLYNLLYRMPEPFVPRRLRLEVDERLDYKGQVVRPLDEDSVRAAVGEARRQGAVGVAICLLHAYANPAHEARVAEIVLEEWPQAVVTRSSDLTNEWREYHRTSTAVLDAYVKPTTRTYLTRLGERLQSAAVGRDVQYAMQSNGGVSRFDVAREAPIHLVESGPVGGIIGAAAIGRRIERPNLICLDIGGTTAKSSLIEDGRIRLTGDYHIGRTPTTAGYPVRVPVVDIVEIGAGGGSVAWLDPAGGLNVGPRSAGAEPGPAAYGRGGTEPTVTDANLVAGRINPDYFLGGRVALDVGRAEAAIAVVAERLGRSVEETALGIIRLADASMVNLLKLVSVRRGHDPREFSLLACGGGGSMHAAALARELHVPEVIVPPHPGHFSAWGMLMSDLRHDAVQTRVGRLGDECEATWRDLEERMAATFAEEGVPADRVRLVRALDMRYAGQEHTVQVELGGDDVEASFHAAHEQLYGFRLDVAVEVVNLRLTGYGAVRKPELRRLDADRDPDRGFKGTREVDFDQAGRVETPTYERDRLGATATLVGPAIVEEPAASTVVFPGQRLTVDELGNLLIATEA